MKRNAMLLLTALLPAPLFVVAAADTDRALKPGEARAEFINSDKEVRLDFEVDATSVARPEGRGG